MMPSCPPAVSELVGGEPWELFPAHGRDGRAREAAGAAAHAGSADRWAEPHRWLVGGHRVTLAPSAGAAMAEAERIHWLNRHLDLAGGEGPVGGTVALLEGRWLVTEGPDGEPVERPELHPEPDRVPQMMGAALRLLHGLDPASCPFLLTVADELDQLAQAVAAGRIATDRLPPPYDRYRPDELLAMAGDRPEDPVVGHGRALAGHVLVTADGPSGLVAVDRLAVTDRHRDLAVAHRHIHALLGGEAVLAFYEGYEVDPDLVALDRGVLLDVLDGAVGPPGR